MAQEKQLRSLAADLAKQLSGTARSPVAITSFTNPDFGSAFSVFLVDRLNILLASAEPHFEVVDRSNTELAYREINLSLLRDYDATTFAKIGKRVGARVLVHGSYTVLEGGATVSVTAQILDVETGRIVGGALIDVPYTGDIKSMLTRPEGRTGADSAQPPVDQLLESHQFVFRLRRCTITRTAVTCKLTVTSPERDRYFRFGEYDGITSMFDQNGIEYRASSVVIANKFDSSGVNTLLVRDVTVQAEVSFTVNANVTTISLLRLRVADMDVRAAFDVQFRNIRP
jgi:TolB-like protein